MQTTARRVISYPSSARTDAPDVPAHMALLAAAIDVDVIYNQGTDAARIAASHQISGGRFWWATDTNVIWYDDGTTWHNVSSSVTTVFGRSGAVVATNGDYTAAQVTGAAVDANVLHLAGVETVTGVKQFNAGPRVASQSVSGTSTLTDGSAAEVLTDTTSAAFTLTLPSAPSAGSWFEIFDSTGHWATHNLTINPNGKALNGVVSNMTLSSAYGALRLYYDGTGWHTASANAAIIGASVTSVFGRTGAVAATSGDYTVSQVTGAAPLASPTFTGTPAAPTPSTADNSTAIATTAFVKAQSYITTSALSPYAPLSGGTFSGAVTIAGELYSETEFVSGGASYLGYSGGTVGFFGASPVGKQTYNTYTGNPAGNVDTPGNTVHSNDLWNGGYGSTTYTIHDIVRILKVFGLITT